MFSKAWLYGMLKPPGAASAALAPDAPRAGWRQGPVVGPGGGTWDVPRGCSHQRGELPAHTSALQPFGGQELTRTGSQPGIPEETRPDAGSGCSRIPAVPRLEPSFTDERSFSWKQTLAHSSIFV